MISIDFGKPKGNWKGSWNLFRPTVEALAPLLQANPRGLLLARDELAGWVGSFDRYSGGGRSKSDAANWLSMHNGESITVDRKTGPSRVIHVPRASVSVCGGIQPGIFARVLSGEHRESGLVPRLLLAWPPRKPKRWTEADIDDEAHSALARLFAQLFTLEPTLDEATGDPTPGVVRLDAAAKARWARFFDDNATEQANLDSDLASAWSKFEEAAARLALVIHLVRWGAGDPSLADADVLDVRSMEAGIELTTWFKHEARRVYAMLDESPTDALRRRLIAFLERHGLPATARDIQANCSWLKEPGTAEAALEDLARSGVGTWISSGEGRGRPTRRFRLAG